ncbi:hypothetical protein C2G38_2138446 [Gigaspora rosea]|uniref:Uncharacterized protein n=1 Tax=Gigaspora rosea TaxID=44941 RepID=A0A397VU76_9GLOM|nr:hypothetical protein C2G38_2138446 [Gigaspora rosea]
MAKKEKNTQEILVQNEVVESFNKPIEAEKIESLNKNKKKFGVAETIESLRKYEHRPGRAKKFLNIIGSSFEWPVSMLNQYRDFVFWALTDDVGSCEDDIKTAYNYFVFFDCLDKGEFNKHIDNWILVYNQEVIEYGQEYTREEQWDKLQEKPGAIYLPADLSKHPKIPSARVVHAQ